MKKYILASVYSLILSFIAGLIVIPLLKKIKAGQPVLKYVETHKDKNGTPTMGGLFFILSSVLVFFVIGGMSGRIATVSVSIGVAFMAVGFIDDFIKIRFHRNEGLKAYQKIIFQTAIAVLAGVFSYRNGITCFNLPFGSLMLNLGVWTIPIVAIIFIAITNCVNLTDGLDGLAGGVSSVYLIMLAFLISMQWRVKFGTETLGEEYDKLVLLSCCIFGGLLAFLVFNTSKARVFMGDTGSLSLGGFLGAISIFSSNSFFIPILGIMFVTSGISVIVQVVHYKRTKKRVFLMAPLHHHFQLKGYTEAQITFCYSLITALAGIATVIPLL